MTEEQILKKEEKLNAQCVRCRTLYGIPTYDHCNYHCTIGAQLHKLDYEKANGWGSHNHWKK